MEAGEVTAATCAWRRAGSKSPGAKSALAFTVTELLITIACLMLLAAVFLPALARSKARSSGTSCSNILKQVGLSCRSWAVDNNDHFPMQVSVTNGGTMELVGSGAVFPHFQVMSSELSTPRILLCPEDKNRSFATNFSDLTDKNLSYFLNVDSVNKDASSLLCGDRNITNRASAGSRFVNITKGTPLAWTKGIHSGKGNIVFGDTRVAAFTNQSVGAIIQMFDGVTNRLAVP